MQDIVRKYVELHFDDYDMDETNQKTYMQNKKLSSNFSFPRAIDVDQDIKMEEKNYLEHLQFKI